MITCIRVSEAEDKAFTKFQVPPFYYFQHCYLITALLMALIKMDANIPITHGANATSSPLLSFVLTGSRSSRENAIKIMDDKIKKMLQDQEGFRDIDLALLKRQRNNYTFISRLPVEVLTEIFMYFRGPPFDEWSNSKISEGRDDLIQIIRVCHRWREVARAYPALWNRIESGHHMNPAQVQYFLDLSRNMPLSIDHEFCDRGPQQNLDFDSLSIISDHLSRVVALRVSGHIDVDWPFIYMSLYAQAPKLQVFILVRSSPDTDPGEEIGSDLFGGCAPQLQHLTIIGFKISFKNPISPDVLHGLKVLRLQVFPQYARLADILGFLRHSPQLEILELDDFYIKDSEESDDEEIVSLPCLERMALYMDAISIGPLIRKLEFSQDVLHMFSCTDYPLMNPEYTIPPILVEYATPCDHLRIEIDSVQVIIRNNPEDPISDLSTKHIIYDLAHCTKFLHEPDYVSAVIGLLVRNIKDRFWSYARTLTFHVRYDDDAFISRVNPDLWLALLESLPHLEWMNVYVHSSYICLKKVQLDILRAVFYMEPHDGETQADNEENHEDMIVGTRFPLFSELNLIKIDDYKHITSIRYVPWFRATIMKDTEQVLQDYMVYLGYQPEDEDSEDGKDMFNWALLDDDP